MIEFELGQRYDKSRFMAFLKTFLPDDYVQQEKILDINFKSNFITKAKSLGACKSIELMPVWGSRKTVSDCCSTSPTTTGPLWFFFPKRAVNGACRSFRWRQR